MGGSFHQAIEEQHKIHADVFRVSSNELSFAFSAVPKDTVPKDTVPKDTVPKDTVPVSRYNKAALGFTCILTSPDWKR